MKTANQKVLVIAEVGVNHNGSIELAKQIIDSVASTDVDIIKFQTVVPELLMVESTPKAEYQKETTGETQSAFDMIRALQFSNEEFVELKAYVESKNKQFLSTAFDLGSLDFLHDLGLEIYKIPSGEITNLPYIRKVAQLAQDIIISTGMSTVEEARAAVDAIVNEGFPKSRITVLQCNTAYPTPLEDTNLRAMVKLGESLGVKFGFSDHTEGVLASTAAVALGATVIEKHVTTDKSLPGPDQHASMEPQEFALLMENIRAVELLLGSSEKIVTDSERMNIPIARRGLYASRDIEQGEVLTLENVIALRPESAISPMKIDQILNKNAKTSIKKHQPISFDLITS